MSGVAGTPNVSIVTCLPRNTRANSTKSLVLPPVRDSLVEISVNIFNSIQCELAEQFSANLANESISIPLPPGQLVKLN